MSETSWKTPAAVIGIAGVILTAIGLLISYSSGNKEQVLPHPDTSTSTVVDPNEKRIEYLQTEISTLNTDIRKCEATISEINTELQIANAGQFNNSLSEEERDAFHERFKAAGERYSSETNRLAKLEAERETFKQELDRLLR